ncbi:MAG: ABC transporter ATP-binding protein [Phycisphaerales bacterium]|nr:ABC transporter ATP-binding protein [Phycisphaerales bacterium]
MVTHAAETGWAIDLTNVSKTYRGKVRALRGIDTRVRAGEIFGLLGPNGAGKSTLVKILMTVIRPTTASGTMLGQRVGHKPTLARVGYLPEHHRFPEYLTGAQVIDYYGALAGMPRAQRRKRRDELLEIVGMKDWADTKVRGYSKGMRQRVGIAQAIVNNPDLVVLDEPTDGVDPVGRRDIRAILVRLKEQGKTVFLNSHLLSELEMVCDRVAILVQGTVASQGTIDELTCGKIRYDIEIVGGDEAAAQRSLAAAAGSTPHTIARNTLSLATTDAAVVQPVIDALRAGGVIIRSIRPVRPSLEDLFMEAVTDPTTGVALPPGARKGAGREGS